MCLWNISVFLVLGGLIDLRGISFPCRWLIQEWTCLSIVAHETEKLLRNVFSRLRGDKKRCFPSFQSLIRSGEGTWRVPCHLSLSQTQDDSKSLILWCQDRTSEPVCLPLLLAAEAAPSNAFLCCWRLFVWALWLETEGSLTATHALQ